jgi:hypothetical protein
MVGVGAAFAAESDHRVGMGEVGFRLALRPIILLLDLPFDRQAVAVPAGNVVRILVEHLLRAGDEILEDLVQRVADVDVAVGVGRAVMQDELALARARRAKLPVEIVLLPAGEDFRLLLRQAGAHRKVRLRQIEARRIIGAGFVGLGRAGLGAVVHGSRARWRAKDGRGGAPRGARFSRPAARARRSGVGRAGNSGNRKREKACHAGRSNKGTRGREAASPRQIASEMPYCG